MEISEHYFYTANIFCNSSGTFSSWTNYLFACTGIDVYWQLYLYINRTRDEENEVMDLLLL